MPWSEIFSKIAIIFFLSGFVVFIIVGYFHGGKYHMSPKDQAATNKISVIGKKFLWIGSALMLLGISSGFLSILLL